MMTRLAPLSFLLLAVLASSCRRAEEAVVFAGSSTIRPIIENLEKFYAKHNIKIRAQGGGSSVGIKSARERLALFGMASRELTDEEKSTLKYQTFARDGVAIIVHSSNPLEQIDRELIRDIYSGKRSQWDNGQTITVINKEAGRATLVVFEEYFDLAKRIRDDAVIIGPNGQAVASTARDPNAIAYVSIADAKAAHDNGTTIKLLKLDGVEATPENIKNGTYKLSRSLNLVYLPENEAKVKPILQLLGDPEAKEEMMKLGFVPAL